MGEFVALFKGMSRDGSKHRVELFAVEPGSTSDSPLENPVRYLLSLSLSLKSLSLKSISLSLRSLSLSLDLCSVNLTCTKC